MTGSKEDENPSGLRESPSHQPIDSFVIAVLLTIVASAVLLTRPGPTHSEDSRRLAAIWGNAASRRSFTVFALERECGY